ncbi:MAG TPA: tetratricopeptide repeat protein [Kofleriaceae bacterium]|nr:tetratricopeptide repeat protein [Kofleriaceae bacterium]
MLLGLGGALAFVPLLDVLGFEFAFVLGVAGAFAGAHLGASAVWERRRGGSGSDGELADARPLGTLLRLWLSVVARVTALNLLPLGVITLNALRVRNCSWGSGLAWLGVLLVPSAAAGAAAGITAGLLRPWGRRIYPTLLAFSIIIGSVLWSVWRFYAAPPIFAHDPFGGYFPGTLYDEEVAITSALVWARGYHVLASIAALALSALLLDGAAFRLRLRAARGRTALRLAALVLALLTLVLRAQGARLGFALDAADIAAALGAERETAHFVLHYAPAGPWAKDLALHADDLELRHAQLKRALGVEPEGRVHAYLFDSPAQKQRLMGAGHTFIAKPWRKEIYVQAEGWPHPVVKHELAHVFAGRFGDPIFGVARRGLRMNVGLIEGVAVAAAWQAAPLTPHQMVKTMRLAGIEPRLGQVLGLRFLGLNASAAYNLAGSFCRFLLDKHGPAKLGQVFHEAGAPAAWQAAYGVPLSALEAEWSKLIDTVEVPPKEAALMRERLSRPSVFHKVCAHELALRREQARRQAAAGDKSRALASLESVCADDPDEPHNLAEVMDAAHAAERPTEAADAARRLLSHPKVTAALKARAEALRGDLAFTRGDGDAALAAYRAAEALPLDEGNARLVTVKRLAAAEPPGPIAELLKRFLITPPSARDAAVDLYTLAELVRLAPDRALHHYLLARQLEGRGRYAEAALAFTHALDDGKIALPDARFQREALRLLGRARFRAGQLEEARAAYQRLAGADAEGAETARVEAADFIERIDHTLAAHGTEGTK